MPRPFLILSQSDCLIKFVSTNSQLNDKQCRSRSVGSWRSQLIWINTICKDRAYPGSAGPGLKMLSACLVNLVLYGLNYVPITWRPKWMFLFFCYGKSWFPKQNGYIFKGNNIKMEVIISLLMVCGCVCVWGGGGEGGGVGARGGVECVCVGYL